MVFQTVTKEEAVMNLGTLRPKSWTFIGVTLNFPPSMVVHLERLKLKIAWHMLPPEIQIEWTKIYIQKVYTSLFDQMYFSFEISEGLKLHSHILGIIEDDFYNYNLLHVRGRVNLNTFAKKHLKYKNMITCNYIHFVEGDKWRDYIFKDDGKNPFYLYRFWNPSRPPRHQIELD